MWVDGGARGNPGPAAVGYRIEDEAGGVLDEAGRTIGVATNNEAEYRALITALERAAALGATEVEVRSDSELLMRQMTGRYRVKSPHLQAALGRGPAGGRPASSGCATSRCAGPRTPTPTARSTSPSTGP